MAPFLEWLMKAVKKSTHSVLFITASCAAWLFVAMTYTIQPALAEHTRQIENAETSIAIGNHSLGDLNEHAQDNSVALARIEGMLELLVEKQL